MQDGRCSARGPSGPEDTNAGEELDQLGDISFETTSKAKKDSEPRLGKASFEPYHFFIFLALPSALTGAGLSLPRPPLRSTRSRVCGSCTCLPPPPYRSKALLFCRRRRLGLKLSLSETRGGFSRLLFEVSHRQPSLPLNREVTIYAPMHYASTPKDLFAVNGARACLSWQPNNGSYP
jgi:hypothetical protein